MVSRTRPPHQSISAPVTDRTPLVTSALAETTSSRDRTKAADHAWPCIGFVLRLDALVTKSPACHECSRQVAICPTSGFSYGTFAGTRARWYFSSSRLALTMVVSL